MFSAMWYSPWYFLLSALLPVVAWRLFARRRKPAVRFSSLSIAQQLEPTWRQRFRWLPAALTLASMLAMIIGLARPREGREKTVTETEGIAIELVVDRSGSMQAMDFKIDDEHVDRLTAIKKVVAEFVNGGDQLAGRFSDLVGLITFAGYADGITPPTLDHGFMLSQLNQTKIATNRADDGTAIGDAIALATERLNGLDRRELARGTDNIKSKIIILLTDGENNAGDLEPIRAAEISQTLGIKIYTIGVGTRGQAPMPATDPFTGRTVIRWMPVTIDEETLQKVAGITGGKYYRATDTDSLENIYREIDELEKTNVEAQHFTDYRELAVQSFHIGSVTCPPILLMAFGLLLARFWIEQTWLRELV